MIVLFILFAILVIWYTPNVWRQYRLKIWRKKMGIDKHLEVFSQLYRDTNGYAISQSARQNYDEPALIYGEVLFIPFAALLSICRLNENSVFYDLGSGIGKAVIACAMIFNVRKSCGIELLPALYAESCNVLDKLARLPEYQSQAMHITFVNQDLLTADLSDATHVFINATGFLGEVWLKISEYLEQLPSNALVISSSKPIRSEKFIIAKSVWATMSWGDVRIFIQQKC